MRRLLAALVLATGLTTAQASQTVARVPVAAPLKPEKVVDAPLNRGPRAKLQRVKPADKVYAYVESKVGARAARRFTPLILAKADKYDLPPLLVAKVINRESSFRPHVELRGCFGLMQVAHFHFKRGQNPYDPATNIDAGCRVLAKYYGRFRNWPQALTAYNFGPNATASRGLYTSRYARLVMAGK